MSDWDGLFNGDDFQIHIARVRKKPTSGGGQSALRRLTRTRINWVRFGAGGSGGSRGRSQYCVITVRQGYDHRANVQHLAYMQKEGKAADGTAPELYGSSDLEEMSRSIKGERYMTRLVLSPEARDVDLNLFTKTFMERLQLNKGLSLTWVASNHYDRDNPHTHVLIRGRDKSDIEFRLDYNDVSTTLRGIASDILTQMLGRRQGPVQFKANALKSKHWIPSDQDLLQLLNQPGGLTVKHLDRVPEHSVAGIIHRLNTLQDLQLVRFADGRFSVHPDAENLLKSARRYEQFLQVRNDLKFTHPANYSQYDKTSPNEIVGIITTKGFISEINNNNYLLVEAIDSRAYFVPLYKQMKVPEGTIVRIAKNADQQSLRFSVEPINATEAINLASAALREPDDKSTGFGKFLIDGERQRNTNQERK